MKALTIFALATCLAINVSGQEADRVKELEQKVEQLQQRTSKLEGQLAAQTGMTPEAKVKMPLFEKRSAKDKQIFLAEDIREAETIYQEAAKEFGSKKCKRLLRKVVRRYPDLNRAGCAQLYLAQMAS